ncbi:20226_t:CDS:2 [Cetraspora pellucida]|uniref:20226_t:CDS:1 n=1 Tax=Cetraspora pellucida TaxID=1433469 RepID=A0A9N9DYV9_9GLOM|nr:20226_t:CDS:2 [Cetraspora pellucida]
MDEVLKLLHSKYGDIFEIWFGSERAIVLCHPKYMVKIHQTSTKSKYIKRFFRSEGKEYGLVDSGVFNNNDIHGSWKFNRMVFSNALMRPKLDRDALKWTIELVKEMESCWRRIGIIMGEKDVNKSLIENDEVINLPNWMRRFTYDMIYRIAIGIKGDALNSYTNNLFGVNNQETESNSIITSTQTYAEGIMYFRLYSKYVRNYVPYIRGIVRRYLDNKEYLYGKLTEIIERRRREINDTPINEALRNDILTSFIIANTDRDTHKEKYIEKYKDVVMRPMKNEEICGNLIDAFIGGTDTTANLFCFIVYYLAHHPHVLTRLRQELDSIFHDDITRTITLKDLDNLKYCESIIKEVARLQPVISSNIRLNSEEDEICGYIWPANTVFLLFYGGMSKRPDAWNEPLKLNPDRFYNYMTNDKVNSDNGHEDLGKDQNIGEKSENGDDIKNSFVMFGGGLRMCPGRKLAMIELKCLVTMIYRKYDVELIDMNAPLKTKSTFITTCEELLFRLKLRK